MIFWVYMARLHVGPTYRNDDITIDMDNKTLSVAHFDYWLETNSTGRNAHVLFTSNPGELRRVERPWFWRYSAQFNPSIKNIRWLFIWSFLLTRGDDPAISSQLRTKTSIGIYHSTGWSRGWYHYLFGHGLQRLAPLTGEMREWRHQFQWSFSSAKAYLEWLRHEAKPMMALAQYLLGFRISTIYKKGHSLLLHPLPSCITTLRICCHRSQW